ncbi:ATP-binding protein [Neptunomonas phycophila]|uniref:hybrid sensor histidine kinase/response regulator n=1 Tax=Neptunomonas phycophila TaxID=1572645 RepID=UPI0026E23D91|nr:ATP-binding protein [Neptunomonas phycophila]MDO6783855.1 ATP-binding protein [Neptunomonas phycophila]
MAHDKTARTKRSYNRWVANQTLEDYALRFTAKDARRWSTARVSNTALGAISFLALEAIGGSLTLSYGFENALAAILVVCAIIFLTGLPISYYAARYGVDIDLLTRGAGFGYIGSTITSLIYASFTFIFFALEAAIMASALEILFDIPLGIAYVICALVVIPLVTHGITFISRFQLWTQPVWVVLQLLPFVFILQHELSVIDDWTQYPPQGDPNQAGLGLNVIYFGAASGILFALMAQIGEQVDFLRFLPEKTEQTKFRWWLAMLLSGPGWVIPGLVKILAGSFLAVLAINHGVRVEVADDPMQMYLIAFSYLGQSPQATLALAGIFVIVSQLKINVTNAYAGSLAWSNFFSRLSHSHPGRVVWLVFNVIIALLIMELGIYEALEQILGIYSNVVVAWVGALVADLIVNKPLGYSPKHIEFKRAHLYDVNPVGFGAMLIASIVGVVCYLGMLGPIAKAFAPFIALLSAFVISPIIAFLTQGNYYIARSSMMEPTTAQKGECVICENCYEIEDLTQCPVNGGIICSLCCTLDARCHDQCKEGARFSDQLSRLVVFFLPSRMAARSDSRILQFSGLLFLIATIVGSLFWLVYMQFPFDDEAVKEAVYTTLLQVFLLLLIINGVLIWLFVLAKDSQQLALEESQRQTALLTKEIAAHEETDRALQRAKEQADSANQAKSRYLTGISHELRTPLNSLLGYAQLLERDRNFPDAYKSKVGLIRRSGEHLEDLIEGLLDISRIEAGRLELSRDQVLLPELMQELVEMFSVQARDKGIEFSYAEHSVLPKVVIADEKHVRQILINLLSNAVKYTERGSVTFSVRYRSQVAEFLIKDTGVGIEKEDQEVIFKPFERIRKPGIPQISGTGLGLTISRLLTDIMGGDLSVESIPKEGSQFKLSLMLSRVDKAQIQKKPVERRIESYKGDQKTIMVVDDDATHRGLVSEILSPLGFVVLESPNAEVCLSTLESTTPDLFLLDISMPGKTGWELLATLRQIGMMQPVIMVSANATERQPSELEEGTRGYSAYLTKPMKDSLLLANIASALKLTWQYEPRTLPKKPRLIAHQNISSANVITPGQAKEIISMAEIGFLQGLDQLLKEIEQTHDKHPDVLKARALVTQCQFAELIALCKPLVSEQVAT